MRTLIRKLGETVSTAGRLYVELARSAFQLVPRGRASE